MDDEKKGNLCVPLISSFFCLCVITGGIFLILYVFVPSLCEPWFPIPAFILIGFPWLFWFFTYLYTCIKPCCNRPNEAQTGPSRPNTRTTSTVVENSNADISSKESESPLTGSA